MFEEEEKKEASEGQASGGDGASGEEGELSEEELEELNKKKKKKKMMIIIALVAVLGGGGGAGFMMHKKKQEEAKKAMQKAKKKKKPKKEQIYHDLADILVNLNTGGKGVSFLKLKVTLDLDTKDNLAAIEKHMPRIKDILQLYLRELRPVDLQGSVGLYRLRDEMLLRINKAIHPAYVNDILFRDVLVQ